MSSHRPVTTPTDESAGFSSYVRLKAQSEPEDVLCRVRVGVCGVPAPETHELFGTAASFRNSSFEANRASKILTATVGFPVVATGLIVFVGNRTLTVRSQSPANDVFVVALRG
jgi:hypothetical protein